MARIPKKITQAYLEAAALHYLERFASSAANLRRVLQRKVQRSAAHWGDDAGQFAPLIDRLLERYQASGLIDDKRYAEAKVASERRRGRSTRAIAQRLAMKGVANEITKKALDEHEGDDVTAARAFAKRRRLGPYRTAKRSELRDKDLAALGRAGFAYEIARSVVDGEID
ncbi:regulatory protein RecX [Roseiterribacter gracilis]|uniref:Regulatory protein RecX n=1 Tax=Roseiterribacter gracilis TaxID=2812848 RepID=A0A8S8XAU0_9PROT|nr:recombinase RecX [Rhodospirillales bacterium TMPK1]